MHQFKFKQFGLFIVVFSFLLLSACSPAPTETTRKSDQVQNSMQQTFNRVYNGTLDAWSYSNADIPRKHAVFYGLLAMLVVGFGWYMFQRDLANSAIAGFVAGLVIGAFAGIQTGNTMIAELPGRAETQATAAVSTGWDEAKTHKANLYVEVLHAPVVEASYETFTTYPVVNSSTNFPEWTHSVNPHDCMCSTDKKGNESCSTCWDTEYVPYFKSMVQYRIHVRLADGLVTPETGLKVDPGAKNTPYMDLSGWMIPQDYQWYDGSHTMTVTSEMTKPPVLWTRYHDMIAAGKVPLLNVNHKYANWLWVVGVGLTPDYPSIPGYLESKLLPSLDGIYSRYEGQPAVDYNFVHFVGGLTESSEWQDKANTLMTFLANDRQMSLFVVFAPKERIEVLGSIDEWVNTIKAYFTQKGVWTMQLNGETMSRMMPKNMGLIACTVRDNIVTACRLTTAMPRGNENLTKAFIDGFKPVPFTPEGFFGPLNIALVRESGKYPVVTYHSSEGKTITDLLLRADPDGLRRVSMKGNEILKSDIVLEEADIDRLVRLQVAMQQAEAGAIDGQTNLALVAMILVFFVAIAWVAKS